MTEQMAGQVSLFDLDTWSGKTYQEHCPRTIVQEDAVIPGSPKEGWSNCGSIMGDGYSIAWRVHDSQHWGVPQRRKRIALLCDFNGYTAGEILFDPEYIGMPEGDEQDDSVGHSRTECGEEVQPLTESLQGDSEKSEQERKEVAGCFEGCT